MKTKIRLLVITLLIGLNSLKAQDTSTVEATNSEVSENLDLNKNGEVDYLRVIESSKDETHKVTIQAVVGKDNKTLFLLKNNE